MNKEIVKHYGIEAQLDMCMEECGELIQACNKVKRADGIGYATYTMPDEAQDKLIEEMAHFQNTILSLCFLMEIGQCELDAEIKRSDEQTVKKYNECKNK